MPIQSTKTTTIPGLPTPSTPDLLAYGIVVTPAFPEGGVTAGNMVLNTTPYRANDDSTSPTVVGRQQSTVLGELAAFAAAYPSLAPLAIAAKQAIDALVQGIVNSRGL